MVEILRFDEAIQHRARSRSSKTAEADDSFSFWPEVRCGLWVSQGLVQPDPINSEVRVLAEVLLILGGTGLLVLLSAVFFGLPQ